MLMMMVVHKVQCNHLHSKKLGPLLVWSMNRYRNCSKLRTEVLMQQFILKDSVKANGSIVSIQSDAYYGFINDQPSWKV
jgi:hypothetical protein